MITDGTEVASVNASNQLDVAIAGTVPVAGSGTAEDDGVPIAGVDNTDSPSAVYRLLADSVGHLQTDVVDGTVVISGRPDVQRVHNIVDGTVSVSSVSGTTQIGGEVYVLGVEGTTTVDGEVYVSGVDSSVTVIQDSGKTWDVDLNSYGWTTTAVTAVYETAQTDTLFMTPTSGKAIVLLGVLLSTNTAMNVEIEAANVDVIPPCHFAANGGAVISGGGPIWKGAADATLSITSSAAGSLSIKIWGYEV